MRSSNILSSKFDALENSGDSTAISAVRCGDAKQHLLIKGKFGEPILLMATEPRRTPRAPVQLKHVGVAFEVRYEVTDQEKKEISIGTYCKFKCEPSSESLHSYFIEVLAATASTHGAILTQENTDDAVDAMLELFRQLEGAPNKTIIGLWGELLNIEASADKKEFIDAWHLKDTDAFDFAFANCRLEVKATEKSLREHDFSLTQVRGGRPGDFIASVLLSRSAAGITVLDLASRIAERVPAAQQQKLWSLVIGSLGFDAEASNDHAFDLIGALRDLRFIPAGSVPAPNIGKNDISFISNVRFRANIQKLCDEIGSGVFQISKSPQIKY